MIGSGELYDLEEEVKDATRDRLQEVTLDLISEVHRLRHLVEEIIDFRSSKDHDETMKTLKVLIEKAGK